MSMTGLPAFDATIEKTNLVLKAIEQEYGWPRERRNESYSALRAVLHALRDRLTVNEAADLAAQLPMLIRGIYYDGWDPARVPVKMDHEEFVDRVREQFNYSIEGSIDQLAATVLQALRTHVTEGEWNDIASNLPKDLAAIVPA